MKLGHWKTVMKLLLLSLTPRGMWYFKNHSNFAHMKGMFTVDIKLLSREVVIVKLSDTVTVTIVVSTLKSFFFFFLF